MTLWFTVPAAIVLICTLYLAISAHWRLDALGHDHPTGRHRQRGEQ